MAFSNPSKYILPVINQRKPRPMPSRSFPWSGLVIGALLPLAAAAQSVSDGAGTSEFQYIETLVFARPAGIAGAYTSLAQGMDAIGYNPAGLSKLESRRAVAGTVRYHFLDVTSGNVTYAFPGMGGDVSAFSVACINYGRIAEIDENGQESGKKLLPASFNPSWTWSKRLSNIYRLGVTGRGYSEYLGDFEGSELVLG